MIVRQEEQKYVAAVEDMVSEDRTNDEFFPIISVAGNTQRWSERGGKKCGVHER